MRSLASIREVKGSRPFAVVDGAGRVVELHRTRAAAVAGRDRLNGVCRYCGELAGAHAPLCPVRELERDPMFGADYDESEGES
jgi:hypothetical protein